MQHSTIKSKLRSLFTAALWLLLWQLAYFMVGSDLLLPSPLAVADKFISLVTTADFYSIIFSSFIRIFSGFVLGLLFGCALAIATAFSPLANSFFSLPMSIIKATPVASFVILALVWISGKNLSIFISFLMVLPLVWSNIHTAITATDKNLLQMAEVYKFGLWKTARYIYLPAAIPYFISAVRVGLGFAWKSGIAGEVIAIPSGTIGAQLYNSKIYLDSTELFAWTAVIILLSMAAEYTAVRILPTMEVSE